jgi:hypothetical protein
MTDNYYFCGSIYRRVKGRDVKEIIKRAEGLDGHLMTTYRGKPALVTDGKLYIFIGKERGFKGIEWPRRDSEEA